MCKTCRDIVERFDKTSLRISEIRLAIHRSGQAADRTAWGQSLAENERELQSTRRELDEHQCACHRMK